MVDGIRTTWIQLEFDLKSNYFCSYETDLMRSLSTMDSEWPSQLCKNPMTPGRDGPLRLVSKMGNDPWAGSWKMDNRDAVEMQIRMDLYGCHLVWLRFAAKTVCLTLNHCKWRRNLQFNNGIRANVINNHTAWYEKPMMYVFSEIYDAD